MQSKVAQKPVAWAPRSAVGRGFGSLARPLLIYTAFCSAGLVSVKAQRAVPLGDRSYHVLSVALVRGASGVFNMVWPRHDPNLFTVVSATLTTYVRTH